jgi:flagellar basal-body rod protein FlgB
MPLANSHPDHIPIGPQDLESITGFVSRTAVQTGIGDENGVSVDEEMMALSENELLYETAAQLLKKKLGVIRYVISGGQ